jgi:hypothetical protein
MPTYVRPRVAIIDPGGGFDPGAAVLIGAAVVALGAVAAFVMAHLVLIAIYAGILAVVGIAGICVLRRFMVVVHEKAPEPALPLAVQAALLAPPRRAIAPVVHHHLHFHGVTPDDVAAILRQQAEPAWPALQEKP